MDAWLEDQNASINTAGAYVHLRGLFLFAVGIRPHKGNIPIVRLGGHREGQETGWQCAVREVYEEADLRITPVATHRTYLVDTAQAENELQITPGSQKIVQEPNPFLVVRYQRQEGASLSVMYLAHTEGTPRPSSEVKGLLLLEKEEIHRLCRETLTLEEFLKQGGRAILNAKFDTQLVLEPFIQLRLLNRILSLQPEIFLDHKI